MHFLGPKLSSLWASRAFLKDDREEEGEFAAVHVGEDPKYLGAHQDTNHEQRLRSGSHTCARIKICTLSDATLCDVYVGLCYVLSQYLEV